MQNTRNEKYSADEDCVRDRGGIPKGFSRKPDGVSAEKSRNAFSETESEKQIRKWRAEALALEAVFETLYETLHEKGDQEVHLHTILNMMSLGVIVNEILLPR